MFFPSKIQYIARRTLAFLLDYVSYIYFFVIFISIFPNLIPNELDDTNIFNFITTVILFFFIYLAKDSISGISIGKWCVGLMVRDAQYPEIIPPLWILFKRNLIALTAYPFEIIKIIFDKDNQRFADKFYKTIVIDNPDKGEFKLRALIASFILAYFFLIFSEFFI